MTDPFDLLRGRARPAAQPAPDAVLGVIAAGRRRRNRALVGGGAGTALLAGVLVLALAGGNEAPQTLDIVDDPSPSAEASAEHEPSAAPTPTASPSASASASASATSSSEPQPSEAAPADPEPQPSTSADADPEDGWTSTYDDGKPGWSGGFGGCSQSDESREQPALGRSLTIETALPRTGWRPGEELEAFVVITNRGTTRREESFGKNGTMGTLWNSSGEPVSGLRWSDAVQIKPVVLDPGESVRVLATALTTMCGDGPDDPEPKLPAGSYSVTFNLGERFGRTPPVGVTLDPRASTRSAWPMEPRGIPRPVGRACDDTPAAGVEIGGFEMSVELDSDTVAPGGTLTATLVATATHATSLNSDRRGSPIYADGATPASSTGVDPGPFAQPEDFKESTMVLDEVPPLNPGDSLRYPVSWVAKSCPASGTGEGVDLAPAAYDVRFGLLVVVRDGERHFWFDDETVRVIVRN